jgi:NAD(P)-dependent dehydrogenase (short-subunit alcohol dehydrogenase family)
MKNVIITGATGNLGMAVTNLFLAEGYYVIATVTNAQAQQALPAHPNLEVRVVNLIHEEEAASFVQDAITRHLQVHAALLLVGGFAMGNLKSTSGEDIKKQLALNFETAYNVARPVYEHMREKGSGRLVFIGARPALRPADGKNLIAYGLSKSLLFKLAEYLNADAKGTDVTATVVVPSTLDTPVNRNSMPDADPNKWVKPEALAEILEFVVSDKALSLRETVLKVYNNA